MKIGSLVKLWSVGLYCLLIIWLVYIEKSSILFVHLSFINQENVSMEECEKIIRENEHKKEMKEITSTTLMMTSIGDIF
jgi:hypothetical protein